VIRFLRQMASLPCVLTGFYFTAVGDLLTDIGSWIEGADDSTTAQEQETPHGTPHAA
jgi:hypothetical protein